MHEKDTKVSLNHIDEMSSNKQKCLVNPVFMRVCGISKGLLITN